MRTIHDAARDVLHAKKLPHLACGLCHLFTYEEDSEIDGYEEIAQFNQGVDPSTYLGTYDVWTEERMLFLLLLAETSQEDFEPDAVSEVEILMLHGMTEEQAKAAAVNRLRGSVGPYYPERGSLDYWLLAAFTWAYTPQGHSYWSPLHSELYAKDSSAYVSINRP